MMALQLVSRAFVGEEMSCCSCEVARIVHWASLNVEVQRIHYLFGPLSIHRKDDLKKDSDVEVRYILVGMAPLISP